jgi:uncharacterized protein
MPTTCAADKSVNGDRGDLDFDEGGQAHNACTACRFDADSWDPGPSRRGDVARALLYMDLRYDGSDGGTPDLELVDRRTSIGERHSGICARCWCGMRRTWSTTPSGGATT